MNEYQPNLVVGRGRLYFDPFLSGSQDQSTGELYFGNTPELNLTRDDTTLDHYSSEKGFKEKDEQIVLQSDLNGTFVTDEINLENVSLFFNGIRDRTVVTAQTAATTAVIATRGRYYQLGTSDAFPSGVRNVDNVKVAKGAGDARTDVPAQNNWEVDFDRGRFYIELDAAGIAAGDRLTVTFDVKAQARETVISQGQSVRGRLRFVADNPIGGNRDHFFPNVRLVSNGDYALKGDDWQQLGFSFEALRRGRTPRHIIDNAGPSPTLDLQG